MAHIYKTDNKIGISFQLHDNHLIIKTTTYLALHPKEIESITTHFEYAKKVKNLKNELLKHPQVVDVSASLLVPSDLFYSTVCTPEGEEGNDMQIYINNIDYDFIDTYKMNIVKGRMFSPDFPSDSLGIVINERAAEKFGWVGADNDPIGKYISKINSDMGTRKKFYVVGVIENFNFESCKSPISANVMFLNEIGDNISIRVKSGDYASLTKDFELIWNKIAPDIPYEYSFLKENFEALYQSEQKMSQLFSVFTSIAILIACLGLLGLAAYTAEQRTKEIGIRKAMGASVSSVIRMLNVQFIKLVIISIILASPIAWYLMTSWLDDFVYKTEIGFGPFVLAGIAAIGIAVLTVGYQSFKAAIANPVNSLKSE